MGLIDLKTYDYVKNHFDEYKDVMKEVVDNVNTHIPHEILDNLPENIYKRGIEVSFYQVLIRHGLMSVPVHCTECPFLSKMLGAGGHICDFCDINHDTYCGDLFFASRKTKPKWCPAEKIKEVK